MGCSTELNVLSSKEQPERGSPNGRTEQLPEAHAEDAAVRYGCQQVVDKIKKLQDCDDRAGTATIMEEPEAEPEGLAEKPARRAVKLIFLDVDGPLAPYTGRSKHAFSAEESFSEKPYEGNVKALRRIVEECGGPEVVKVVLSSNWRTMADRVLWLEEQMRLCGLDFIGHTDVMHIHPARLDQEASRRVLEVHRALTTKVLGTGGPRTDPDNPKQAASFSKLELPADWEITNWIAIDDLCLDAVPEESWDYVKLYSAFIAVPTDSVGKRSWIHPPEGFPQAMRDWSETFKEHHLVEVSPYSGLACTPGAVDLAISLLNADQHSTAPQAE